MNIVTLQEFDSPAPGNQPLQNCSLFSNYNHGIAFFNSTFGPQAECKISAKKQLLGPRVAS